MLLNKKFNHQAGLDKNQFIDWIREQVRQTKVQAVADIPLESRVTVNDTSINIILSAQANLDGKQISAFADYFDRIAVTLLGYPGKVVDSIRSISLSVRDRNLNPLCRRMYKIVVSNQPLDYKTENSTEPYGSLFI